MRRLVNFEDRARAAIFEEILLGSNIEHELYRADGQTEVWILRDEELEPARVLLEAWEADPGDARFAGLRADAGSRRQAQAKDEAARAATQARRDRASAPVRVGIMTISLIGVAVICTLLGVGGLANIGDALFTLPNADGVSYLFIDDLMFASDGKTAYIPFLYWVRQGQIWRLFTPAFVHTGGFFHLFFNAYWCVILGSRIETRKGALYLLILSLLTGALSSLGQYTVGWAMIDPIEMINLIPQDYGLFGRIYFGGPLGGGLSGVVYGLFGYILVKGRVDPQSGLNLSSSTMAVLLIWLLACFAGRPEIDPATGVTVTVGVGGRIANIAHLAGLLSGGLWGLVSHRIHSSW